MGFDHFPAELEDGYGLFASDGREVVEKLGERISSLQIIVQVLHRYPRANEHWRSAQDFWVAVNDGRRLLSHVGLPNLQYTR